MKPETLANIIGTGLLHEGSFGALIKEYFPTATQVDLYGSGIQFSADGKIVSISCQGRTLPMVEKDSAK